MRTRLIAVAVAGVLAAACTDSQTPTAVGLEEPLASLSDANHSSGNPHFFFLPPIVQHAGPFSGEFDHTLDPVVDICVLDASGCAEPVAHFTTWRRHDRGHSERLRRDGNHYEVNWHTRRFDLNPANDYRICVSVGPNALGHADVNVLGHGERRRDVDRAEFVPLRNGATLPIKFRIEEGALEPGAFVDADCAGALRPGEIRGTKCLVTADEDEHDEDDDQHPEPSPSLSGRGDRHDDDHDGHDRDGRDEHDDDDDDRDEDHDRDNHRARCEHDDDDDDGGLKDWPISLSGTDYQGDPVTLNTTTDGDGKYSFAVQPGTYTVCEPDVFVPVFPNGFVEVFPSAGANCGSGRFGYSLVLGSGQIAKHKDFGNTPLAGIHGTKLVLNADGSPSSDASGWHIDLLDGNGNLVTTATTGTDGKYAFTKLAGGSYTVCEEMKEGFTQTLPTGGTSGATPCTTTGTGAFGYAVALSAGQNVTGKDFGNQAGAPQETAGIFGTVFFDADLNGVFDFNERGVSGWPITLSGTANTVFTDANGRYSFTGLASGNYTICSGPDVLPEGFFQSLPTAGPSCTNNGTIGYSVPFAAGDVISGKDFGHVEGGG